MNQKAGKKKVIVIVGIVLLLAICGYAGYRYLFNVTPVFYEKTYELGDVEISEDITAYIDAKDFLLKKAVLNTSAVEENKVGEYIVTCDVRKDHFDYVIRIEDTTRPAISFIDADINYGTYNEYSLDEIAAATDLSKIVKFEIDSLISEEGETIDIANNIFLTEQPGEYVLTIKAEDAFGNVATEVKQLDILEAPHFILLSDRKYRLGSDYDPLDFVYAEDKNGNDITDRILIEDNDYDTNTKGDYEIVYAVTDDDNITRKDSITISVDDYKRNDYGYENDEFIETLIAYGYFKYEPLVGNDDEEAIKALTTPTSFGIKTANSRRSSSGSCYLYELTKDHMTFITNKHCKHVLSDNDIFYIYDCDDSGWEIKTSKAEMVTSKNRDIMYFTIPTSSIDTESLLKYKEVYIDWDIYDSMKGDEKAFVNTQCWGLINRDKFRDISSTIKLDQLDVTKVEKCDLGYAHVRTHDRALRAGQSGSPLFSYEGKLIGTAVSVYRGYNENDDLFIRIDDLYDLLKDTE